VFGKQPCPLSNFVVLAFVQQLGADLSTNTALKLHWLTEALKQLSGSELDPQLRDELPAVLQQLAHALSAQIARDPGNLTARTLLQVVSARLR